MVFVRSGSAVIGIINESTLFPELEHQLSYIKYINSQHAREVAYFVKLSDLENEMLTDLNDIDENSAEKIIEMLLNAKLKEYGFDNEYISRIMHVLENNYVVDWYKKEQVLSKIRIEWTDIVSDGLHISKNEAKRYTKQILDVVLDTLKNSK